MFTRHLPYRKLKCIHKLFISLLMLIIKMSVLFWTFSFLCNRDETCITVKDRHCSSIYRLSKPAVFYYFINKLLVVLLASTVEIQSPVKFCMK